MELSVQVYGGQGTIDKAGTRYDTHRHSDPRNMQKQNASHQRQTAKNSTNGGDDQLYQEPSSYFLQAVCNEAVKSSRSINRILFGSSRLQERSQIRSGFSPCGML